jgi:hypothetical protein
MHVWNFLVLTSLQYFVSSGATEPLKPSSYPGKAIQASSEAAEDV